MAVFCFLVGEHPGEDRPSRVLQRVYAASTRGATGSAGLLVGINSARPRAGARASILSCIPHFPRLSSSFPISRECSPPSISGQSAVPPVSQCNPSIVYIAYNLTQFSGNAIPSTTTNAVRHWEDMNSYDLGCKTCLSEAFFIRMRHNTILF